MEWLIIFVQRLFTMWTVDDATSRPGSARQLAPAYARRMPLACRQSWQGGVDRTERPGGYAWFPREKTRLRCAPRATEGPPDG
jgi:hypothetical protein